VTTAYEEVAACEKLVLALKDLDASEQRRVLRWAIEVFVSKPERERKLEVPACPNCGLRDRVVSCPHCGLTGHGAQLVADYAIDPVVRAKD